MPDDSRAGKAEEMLGASKKAGLRIHSVMNQAHWASPLSSPDPAVVEKSLEGMRDEPPECEIVGRGLRCCWFRPW